jgi:mannose-6-phosphate isomerase-like protein (cupin superfamily)
MSIANWKTQSYNVIQSLLFNNRHRVVSYLVRDLAGGWCDRASQPAPVRRLFETEAPPERTCLETIQFVHHVLIPPGGRHVAELHIHPDAEELVVVTRGQGTATVESRTIAVGPHDVLHIPTGAEHKVENAGDDLLGLLFINVPTGEGLVRLLAAKSVK